MFWKFFGRKTSSWKKSRTVFGNFVFFENSQKQTSRFFSRLIFSTKQMKNYIFSLKIKSGIIGVKHIQSRASNSTWVAKNHDFTKFGAENMKISRNRESKKSYINDCMNNENFQEISRHYISDYRRLQVSSQEAIRWLCLEAI